MSTLPTGNINFSVTTWGYPWLQQMHWLDHYMNLSSLLPIELEGLILGDRLKAEISNHSHAVLGWVVTFIYDADILDAYYYTHYANNTESMVICKPFVSKLPAKLEQYINQQLQTGKIELNVETSRVGTHMEHL